MSLQTETILVLLFVIASGVALLARRLRLPYTVALVVAGLLLGQLHALEPPHLTQELLFAVFLPGLLFEAAFHLDFAHFRRDHALILSLAVPGVIAAILLTAAILVPAAALLPLTDVLTWPHALVFGALIAATDPIAVVGLFRSVGAPHRLAALLEGESLLNDGTSIVFFGLILGVVGGAAVTVSGVVLEFARVVGLGVGVGFVLGLTISTVIQKIDDPMIEITLTSIAAYGSFVAAEQFHGSGVIATVAAGMVCGNYGARVGMTPTTRVAVETFWEYVAFALNSIVFLLIGFEVRFADMLDSWQLILSAFMAVLVGRTAVVYTVSAITGRRSDPIPRSWRAVLSWGGLRGGLSMVLALGLAADFPNRDRLIATTYGVVLLSILIQGLTMAPLLRRLGVVQPREERTAYDMGRGELRAVKAALTELEEMVTSGQASPGEAEGLRAEYQARLQQVQGDLQSLHLERSALREEDLRRVRRHLLMVEKAEALESSRQGLLGREAYDRMLTDVNHRLLKLDSSEPG